MSVIDSIKKLLFGDRESNQADQKERRDRLTDFLETHEEETEERIEAARKKRENQPPVSL